MNRKKIFLTVLFGMLMIFSVVVLKDEFSVENKVTAVTRPVTGKVKRDKNKLIAGPFSNISRNMKWKESNELYFKESSEEGEREYKFDLEELALSLTDESVFSDKEYDYFIISENGEKIAYYNEEKKLIETENLKKEKIKEIKYDIGGNPEKYFNEGIVLSSDGGYLFLTERYGIIFENTFTVFGADSGALYGENIKGISPEFSKDSKKVAFFYNGNMNDGYSNAKIGILSLKNKKITYVNTHNKDQIIFPKIMWDDDSKNIFYLLQNRGETEKIHVIKVNISTSDVTMAALPFKGDIGNVEETILKNGRVYILDKNRNMATYDFNTTIFEEYHDVNTLYDDKNFILLEDGVLVNIGSDIKNLKIDSEEFVYKLQKTPEFIKISEDHGKIAVIEEDGSKFNIIIVDIK